MPSGADIAMGSDLLSRNTGRNLYLRAHGFTFAKILCFLCTKFFVDSAGENRLILKVSVFFVIIRVFTHFSLSIMNTGANQFIRISQFVRHGHTSFSY